ncbi:COP9 signalosome complex subunit 1 [Podosphaera aphanis]|nr:COP9 signalosome complex subunit 1 [Podosphaera aphanis]
MEPTPTTAATPIINKHPKFDLESYLSNYTGRTRLERLIFIGLHSSVLGIEALRAAIHEAKEIRDVNSYLEAQGHLEKIGPFEPEAQKDLEWVTTTEQINLQETQRLEAELKQYKNNLIKESIRIGNEDLGKHYQAIGELSKAFDAFSRMRQEASISKHMIDTNRHLIDVAVEQRNWFAVISNIQKMRQSLPSNEDDKSIRPYLCAAEGLASMNSGKYYEAAAIFLNTESIPGQTFNTLLSPNDIAIYGGLCALAMFERKELQSQVLDNTSFRVYLELEPHIRRAITFFVNSRYSACLDILEAYRTDFYLDIHLHKYFDELYCHVRKKCIIQYFSPFSCVTIASLNQAFSAPGESIEMELIKMIERKDLDARIDTQNQLLISAPNNPRHTLQLKTLITAKRYEQEARLKIQHMNITSADLEIKSSRMRQNHAEGGSNASREGLRKVQNIL